MAQRSQAPQDQEKTKEEWASDVIDDITELFSGIDTGSIILYAGVTAPSGWLLCDGSAISRTTYSSLFSLIGTIYGSGNGSTTFNVPDLRQRFPMGKNSSGSGTASSLGETGGAIDHTHVYTDVPQHTHTITDPGHAHDIDRWTPGGDDREFLDSGGPFAAPVDINTSGEEQSTNYPLVETTTGITIAQSGTNNPSTASNNPPFLAVNYIIKT